MTARYGTEDAAVRPAETAGHACGPLLERAQEALGFERERADKAEANLAKVRELAESWTADDGHGLPTREMLTEADCGRSVLALLGETAGVPS